MILKPTARFLMAACLSLTSLYSIASCENAIKDFYMTYMRNAQNNPDANTALMQSYMTQELIDKMTLLTAQRDADAVIDAQDVSAYGIQSITVQPIKDNWYTVRYLFTPDSRETLIQVQARDCDTHFIITDINCTPSTATPANL